MEVVGVVGVVGVVVCVVVGVVDAVLVAVLVAVVVGVVYERSWFTYLCVHVRRYSPNDIVNISKP